MGAARKVEARTACRQGAYRSCPLERGVTVVRPDVAVVEELQRLWGKHRPVPSGVHLKGRLKQQRAISTLGLLCNRRARQYSLGSTTSPSKNAATEIRTWDETESYVRCQ
ncbi:hypothetical protein VOLCADRAFT_96732 [Volvox carteri f. nagariensis]|uniref:Uncharacterized protein n=1 Tax=Volvox carteri f. nagariensis TaxID=3068 RepID=D8UAW7_VOLCA|nr:uncharacterized protein VOLCADRAFT_96732 [Volvox carteri f. nagariensis]EFJ43174.1 hypothetical protein VOLCADRAFT_96732 [Volvox carteri f. nagariensis]|eukprot:XP_002955749.1 hypothetical protein VOLCADRAFT_96732 [Volvox carteri f. nagariensis]